MLLSMGLSNTDDFDTPPQQNNVVLKKMSDD